MHLEMIFTRLNWKDREMLINKSRSSNFKCADERDNIEVLLRIGEELSNIYKEVKNKSYFLCDYEPRWRKGRL